MKKNYYDVLGVSKNATQDEIKKKYRQMSKKLHPDRNKAENAEEQFKELNEAYSVLSDPDKKQMYDTYGTVDPEEAGFGGGFDPFMGGFDPFMGGFNPFSGSFGRNERRPQERGDDLKITIDVDFEDLFYGVHKKIKLTRKCSCHRCNGSGSETNDTAECPHCHGSGVVTQSVRRGNMMSYSTKACPHCHGTGIMIKDPCPSCGGTGLESKKVDVEFDIPAGMVENAYFVVPREGNEGPHRGMSGDLLVNVREKPSRNGLKRDDGNNLLYTARVPYKDLVLGADIEIPYINSTKKIHIEAGTESGKVLKLYRMGFPNPNDKNQKSDYIVTIQCLIPKAGDLSEEERSRIESL